MFIEDAILLAYITTVISEIVIIFIIQRPKKEILSWIIAIFLINSLTHPIAIFLVEIQNISFVLVEIGVIIVEMFLYYFIFKLTLRRSFVISGAANIFSIFVGVCKMLLIR